MGAYGHVGAQWRVRAVDTNFAVYAERVAAVKLSRSVAS